MLSCVAGFIHICIFMAGAIAMGDLLARHRVLSRSFAIPAANLAIISAVAGAIRIRSAQRASSICPTQEHIDPVRYLSNHSSGKMGFEIARAAHIAGAEVTLIAGPVAIETTDSIHRINVTSAIEMQQQVLEHLDNQHIFIGCAAVADYRVAETATTKIKKDQQQLVLTMVENPDIIASVSKQKNKPFCVGFAAETNNVVAYARNKLIAKNLDMICANDVSDSEIGFNGDNNQLTVITASGQEIELERATKRSLSQKLVKLISEQLGEII